MILASKERIKEYTEAGCWGSRTLLDDFELHVKETPDKVAIVDPYNKADLLGIETERPTFAELNRAVEGTAAALKAMGVGKDDIIMVQLPNCWELAMLYLAICKAGGVTTPSPMQWRSKELSYVAGITDAKLAITVEDFSGHRHADMFRDIAKEQPSLEKVITYTELRELAKTEPDPSLADIHVDGNDIFTICWTSGTEAQPKGCPLSHNNWRCQSGLVQASGTEKGDTKLTAGPLVNMASVGTVYVPWLLLGGTMVLHHPFDPATLLTQMIQEQIQYTLLVPAVVNMMLKHPALEKVDLGFIKTITVGSAPPSLWSLQEFKKRWDIDIGNIWGQNEGTAIISGVKDVPDMETRVDSLPRYGVSGVVWSADTAKFIQTKIVDGQDNELTGEGDVGELLYRGPNVIPGYFKRPDLNEKSFDKDGYIRTGDLFQLTGGGKYLKFFDRAKDIIIRGGYNISAQEVENAIMGHPDVADVAAIGMPDEDLGERTCVYIVPAEGKTIDLQGVVNFMKDQGTAVYKLPENLIVVDQIPRNPVGKVVKNRLRDDLKKRLSQ